MTRWFEDFEASLANRAGGKIGAEKTMRAMLEWHAKTGTAQ